MTANKKKTSTRSSLKKQSSAAKNRDRESDNPRDDTANKQVVPLLPLRDIVIFPHMQVPFFVGREKSINALEASMKDKTDILLCSQTNGNTNNPTFDEIYKVGTLATILQLTKLPDGTLKVIVEGKKRAKICNHVDDSSYMLVEVEELNEEPENRIEAEAIARTLRQAFESYVKLNKRISHEILVMIQSIDNLSRLADTILAQLNPKLEEKQALLETADPLPRMEKIFSHLQQEIEILQVEKRIRNRVKKQIEKGQKEYYLNEQLAAIQKELGERDEFKNELAQIEKQIKTSGLSEEAAEKASSELKKLRMMSPMSAEATVIRNYLDWILSMPWKETTVDNLDLVHARNVLDDDHYGLEKIKERIIEYLAVQALTKKLKGPILCFVGPPGVGKTSLGSSIAKAVERKFVRIALGGMRDEAEIRGHRRTYIGAMPGKIIQGLKKANSRNPVVLLDEIDKLGSDFRGDPSSALLEVLDPEQNSKFNDHFLEVDYDLSQVMFIATANYLGGIPQPLMDRMEIIQLSSYTEIEKFQIAIRHLVPKQLEGHGLDFKSVQIDDNVVTSLIRNYTREAGVRNLEREVATIARKAAKKYVEQPIEKRKMVFVKDTDLEDMLGPHRYKYGAAESSNQVGVTTGLAWTEVGGDTLQIEVTILPGRGKLTITGKLGEVMQESAQAAYSYVRSRATKLGIPKDFYAKVDIHIHVPEGATPKDGPSAGITMATALTSALTNRSVRKDVAMTGEITLRGHVLAIGGLKEKLLAAHRAGITTVVIPDENVKDLYDVPKEIMAQLTVIPVKHVDEVLRIALVLEDKDPLTIELGELKKGVHTEIKQKKPLGPTPKNLM
jgi:ATP-dependent Lon protease